MTVEFKATLRRWGRSMGIVVPKENVDKEHFGENEEVVVTITKKENPLKKHFGIHKFDEPIDVILKEGDRDSWDE